MEHALTADAGRRQHQRLALLLAGVCLAPLAAHAQDATWRTSPANSNWTNANNWTPATVPTGMATFGATSIPNISITDIVSIGTMQFNPGAPAYSFTISGPINALSITGAGVVNNSFFVQSFQVEPAAELFFAGAASITGPTSIINNAITRFHDTSSAGTATITNNNNLLFSDSASAGHANITTNSRLFFENAATAGNASITNALGSLTIFSDTASAGHAFISNQDTVAFDNASTADSALIGNQAGANMTFRDNATGASASIFNFGALTFTDASTAGSSFIATAAGATLAFSGNSTGGNALLTADGGGTVDFSRSAGPLGNGQLSAGSIDGAGTYFLGSNRLTVGGNNRSTNVSGSIRDGGGAGGVGGSLIKEGSGTLTLSGTNTYTGLTTVRAGTLNVTGSLLSVVGVANTATLTGTGSIAGLNLASGGTVAPGTSGASTGTLSVNGNAAFLTGSTYRVDATAAGTSDRIVTTGTTTINPNTTVRVNALPGFYPLSKTYTIVTATGGRTGAFGQVIGGTFLVPSLSYDATHVFLTISKAPFQIAAVTLNQSAVANALNTMGGNDLTSALLQLDAPGAQHAFDLLSGEVHATLGGVLLNDATFMRSALLSRLRQSAYGAQSIMGALGVGGPVLAYAPPDPTTLPAGIMAADPPLKARPAGPAAAGPVWWVQGLGAWGRVDGGGNAAGLTRQLAGVLSGVDVPVWNGWRAGFAAGYTNAQTNVDDRASSASVDAAHLGLYAGGALGAFNLRTGAAAAWHSLASTRTVAFAGFSDRDTARYGAWTGQVFGEVGYGMALGTMALEPFAGIAGAFRHTDAFTETGGLSALSAASNDQSVGYSTLGLRAATSIAQDNGLTMVPHASAAWQHAFGNVTPAAGFAFLAGGSPFTIAGVPIARNTALLDAGLDIAIRPGFTVGAVWVGQFGNGLRDNAVKGRLTVAF